MRFLLTSRSVAYRRHDTAFESERRVIRQMVSMGASYLKAWNGVYVLELIDETALGYQEV